MQGQQNNDDEDEDDNDDQSDSSEEDDDDEDAHGTALEGYVSYLFLGANLVWGNKLYEWLVTGMTMAVTNALDIKFW